MKFLDLFSGIGGFRKSLEDNGHECVGYVEKDKFARLSYQAMYNTENEWTREDITTVTNEEFAELKGSVDIITGGFPCFEKGTLITTSKGYKNIEDIKKGDLVLTHTNTFKEVIEPMVKHKKGIYELKIVGQPITKVTEEHPYYVRELINTSGSERVFSEPKWVTVKDLKVGKHFLGFAENKNSINHYNLLKEDAWLLGKGIAGSQLGAYPDLQLIVKDCVDGFSKLLDLPVNILKLVLDGFLSSNLDARNNCYVFTTENKEFAYSLAQAIQKVYHKPIDIESDTKQGIFCCIFDNKSTFDAKYIEGMLYYPLVSLDKDASFEGFVYNFEVAEDNSYVANNAAVHNCQSFSIAGKRLGFADETRGTLFFDIIRAAKEIEPKILFLENVKGLLNHDSGNTFKVMLGALEELGYTVDYKVFNSKYFDVPQNRERIFIVATKNYEKNWQLNDIVSAHTEVNKSIKDILEPFVDDKFHIQGQKLQQVLDFIHTESDGNKNVYDSLIDLEKKSKLVEVGNTSRTGHRSHNVYSSNGISPTLTARDFKGPRQIADYTGDVLSVRKLTPLEYWRIQGYTDEQFFKAKEVNSNSQLYKQAGNSVTVNVIQKIAEQF